MILSYLTRYDLRLQPDAAFLIDLLGHLGQQSLHIRRRRAAQIDGKPACFAEIAAPPT